MPSDDSPGGGILGAPDQGYAVGDGASEASAGDSRGPSRVTENVTQVAGGAGDSPVRGTLVERGNLEGSGIGQAAAGLVASGPAQRQVGASLARDLAVAQKADDRVRRRAERIEQECLNTPNYDLGGGRPEGVSERRWRILQAANSNMKATPFWLTVAHKIAESYRKTDAVKDGPPVLNSPLIQINIHPGAQLPVRKLRDD